MDPSSLMKKYATISGTVQMVLMRQIVVSCASMFHKFGMSTSTSMDALMVGPHPNTVVENIFQVEDPFQTAQMFLKYCYKFIVGNVLFKNTGKVSIQSHALYQLASIHMPVKLTTEAQPQIAVLNDYSQYSVRWGPVDGTSYPPATSQYVVSGGNKMLIFTGI